MKGQQWRRSRWQRQRWWVGGVAVLVMVVVTVAAWSERREPVVRVAPAAVTDSPFLPQGAADSGWPFLRGVNYDGHSAELRIADRWPHAGPPVLWSRSLGQGYSALVAHDQRVFTQVQTLGGQYVTCLDADSGATVWEYRYEWPYDSAGVYPGPRATPTFYNGHLYFASPRGLIGCLDADTGKLVWSVDLTSRYQGKGTDFGYSCSPTVLEGRVFLPVGGPGASMVALSAADGSEVWRSGNDSASYTPAFPIEYQGRKLLVGYLENVLVILDRQTGEIVCRESLSHGYDEHAAWPVFREPYLWTSGPFRRGSTLWRLPTDGGARLTTVWSSETLSNDVMSSVLVGGHLYGFDIRDVQAKTHRTSRGVFRCVEWETGKVAWSVGDERKRAAEGPTVGHASVIVADGKLLVLNDTGELILARANPERYEELARASILSGEIGWTPPTLHRGRLYARNHSRAVCVHVGEPELLEASLRDRATTIDQLPQHSYRDWASVILPVEPEYVFDVPSRQWLVRWYWWSVAILATSWFVAFGIAAASRRARQASVLRTVTLSLAIVGGALGTTLLSQWRGEFIFTWALALYGLLHVCAVRLPMSRRSLSPQSARRSLVSALLLAIGGAAYFLLCRRLSLVFEWAFLAGFLPGLVFVSLDGLSDAQGPATAPAGADARRRTECRKTIVALLATLFGFTAFYGTGVALLWLRY